MQNNLLKLLAVPLILVLAMAIIVFLNQPKVKIISDVNYVEMNGDEYLAEEITTTKEEQIGGYPETKIAENYFFPNELSDCEIRQGAQKENCYLPFPAIARIYQKAPIAQELSESLVVLENLGNGKNVTPLTENIWMFRKDGEDHKLQVFEWEQDRGEVKLLGVIDLSGLIPWWGEYRMGTTMAPIWLNEKEALMLMHGIRLEDGIYHYSIGRAKLVKDEKLFRIVAIDQEPLITPQHF
ncbi:MAG: hypothetical protein QXZ13_01060, partial [Candidatus Diapherotrites archaeon]